MQQGLEVGDCEEYEDCMNSGTLNHSSAGRTLKSVVVTFFPQGR